MGTGTQRVTYHFEFGDGTQRHFALQLRTPDMRLLGDHPDEPPAWTRLSHHQCANCPLNEAEHPHCPIALRMSGVIDFFKDVLSYEDAEIVVVTENRTIFKETKVAAAVSSLIGLHMVTSGCPIMDHLRPMALTHLPFATRHETLYRALSMYLLAQYFVQKQGGEPDWALHGLLKLYDEISVVNSHFAARLKEVCARDASLNALVTLDCFATMTAMSIESDDLGDLAKLFNVYLVEP
jgi:hypothetical protein